MAYKQGSQEMLHICTGEEAKYTMVCRICIKIKEVIICLSTITTYMILLLIMYICSNCDVLNVKSKMGKYAQRSEYLNFTVRYIAFNLVVGAAPCFWNS